MSELSVSVVQMNSQSDWLHNLSEAKALAREAVSASGSRVILFPENFLCFGASGLPALIANLDDVYAQLSELAQDLGVSIIAGSIPHQVDSIDSSAQDSRYFSRSLVFNALGQVCAKYDKLHLFDVDVADGHGQYRESDQYRPGEHTVVTELEGHTLGMSICYDLRFAGLYSAMRDSGAELFCVPSAFTYVTGKAHWELLLRARAIENQCFVLAANQVGSHSKGRETWGHSMIIDPWGKVLASCEDKVGYCSASLDFSQLEDLRRKLPVAQHQRPDLY